MDYENLHSLKEDLNTEFKLAKTRVPVDFYETYSAFANTDGGDIFLGVEEENGEVKDLPGIANPAMYRKSILDTVANKSKCSMSLLDDSSFEEIPLPNGRFVLRIHVDEMSRHQKPLYLDGDFTTAFVRRGSGDYVASKSQLISFLNDVRQGSYDFSVNSSGIGIEGIERESLKGFRKLLEERNPGEIDTGLDDEGFLIATKMLKESGGKHVLTNGAILMLGTMDAIMTVFPTFFVDYQENPHEGNRYDYRLCSIDTLSHCNIFDYFINVRARSRNILPTPYEVFRGQEISGEKILEAFTEALVNALCNADYLTGSSLLIVATPREFVIRNTGKPYLSIKEMIDGGISEPRNTELMRFFRLLRYCQRTGYGIANIFATMRRYSYPQPNLIIHSSPDYTEMRLLFFGREIQGISTKLSAQDLLSFIASKDKGVSQKEIVEVFRANRKTVAGVLNALMAAGYIRTNDSKTKGKLYFIQGIKPYA
ncbi:MAG: putative DNA binding domain-containing protein [Bacilli bacterium]|nr:putative DNA binding domain-containing protein [Bacilli bacterium]MBR6055983.1 putative DNA binding domain-containing protein [Bacilli bacterium]